MVLFPLAKLAVLITLNFYCMEKKKQLRHSAEYELFVLQKNVCHEGE